MYHIPVFYTSVTFPHRYFDKSNFIYLKVSVHDSPTMKNYNSYILKEASGLVVL